MRTIRVSRAPVSAIVRTRTWLGAIGSVAIFSAAPAAGQAIVPLPYFEYHDAADPAPYEILVPANWAATDYTLISYQHGYFPDEPGNVLPFPPLETYFASADNCQGSATPYPCVTALTDLGYAVIGSSYSLNGWAVKQGFADTQALLALFKAQVGHPKRTIAAADSMGSLITLKLLEERPSLADGAIVVGDIGGGTSRLADFGLAEILAWDVAFRDQDGGWDESWGRFADPAPGLLSCSNVPCTPYDPASKFFAEMADPGNFGRFEFIRLVVGLKNPYFTEATWADPNQFWFNFMPAFFATEGFSNIKQRIEEDTGIDSCGRIAQNLDHHYTLSDDDRNYLASLPPAAGPLGFADTERFLDEMNERRYPRDPRAAEYLEAYFDPTGEIEKPVITMKDIGDPYLPPPSDFYFHEAVAQAGNERFLLQLFRAEFNHSGFTVPQFIEAVAAMRHWIDTGEKPKATDFQPANPGPGDFVPFTPGPFPYLEPAQ